MARNKTPQQPRRKLTADRKKANASGLPTRKQEMSEFAQAYGQQALSFQVQVMNDPDAATKDRLSAAKDIIERGYGRPHQAIRQEDGEGNSVIPHQIQLVAAPIPADIGKDSD